MRLVKTVTQREIEGMVLHPWGVVSTDYLRMRVRLARWPLWPILRLCARARDAVLWWLCGPTALEEKALALSQEWYRAGWDASKAAYGREGRRLFLHAFPQGFPPPNEQNPPPSP